MDVKNLVDVSSSFLFEATGDSEAAVLDPGMPDVNHANEDDGGDAGGDDDDAGSCICDALEIHTVSKIYEGSEVRQVSDDEEEEENGEVVEQDVRGWDKDQHTGLQREQTSRVSGDSKKTMDEREKSKLFWETCLAS
ncbi:hypothetical protein SLEP1_g1207 [Rubroshorea leprosula]|uniref:Uncharacterized protein n=1 Tax=Rubroshorea leprosula TaxID=152421 RepID=A0AAV5HLU9_9ROSI|nr:hypothetical protein SLEP1_g1207 [Rubroshorea leprosula]